MWVVLPVHKDIKVYIKKHELEQKFAKQVDLLERSIKHPSLNIELMEPKHLRLFSFRIDRKYRATFIFRSGNLIEILDANNHYR